MSRKAVMITGSSKGLGEALALVFARNRHDVILHGTDEHRLARVRAAVVGHDVECEIVRGDITSRDTIDRLCEAAERRDLDILINNAGAYLNKPFLATDAEEFRRVIEVNLLAPIVLTRKIFTVFQRKQSGLVINVNSAAGKNGSDGESAYCASKHGLRGFTRSIQFEANRDGVRVIEVYLGAMNTAMTQGRKDPGKCIQTPEAADLIWKLCQDYPSMRLDEIDLSRRRY